ncbi:MAG: hypothetical protein K2J73_03460 [Oscillospiraceae bacterium]|nr:hypothetical protein [Oscillospiraceae bacterium]
MEEKGKCKSAVNLAVWGAVIGIVLFPSVGVTLAVSGLIVNTIERRHYDMTVGLIANILSIILSVLSWCLSAKIIGLI